MVSVCSVDALARAPGHAVALAALDLDPHARRLPVLRVGDRDVGDVDRAFLVDDPADGLGALRAGDLAGALVALDHVEALDPDLPLFGVDAHDAAALAGVLAADDDDGVVLADARGH